ncbi:D-serine ammonia-lyase [Undibacterium sp. TJN25]|uniref:D-serine ammonia-lyase n=1 Tax=Undibacterium sp. TJN25 TaxID=3413056 RepID=UPI003BF313B3
MNLISSQDQGHALASLQNKTPFLWTNPGHGSVPHAGGQPHPQDIQQAANRLQRFAPLLAQLFPEVAASGGIIESELMAVPRLQDILLGGGSADTVNSAGRIWIKGDHALPIAGSIKARGGIHEVLEFAERLATEQGLIHAGSDYLELAGPQARSLFGRYTVAVGSTGNLGLSIGVIASALGFKAAVHMSADAKEWKKERLRKRGVQVVEHQGDYEKAVAAGRSEAQADPYSYFVDDEHSLSLFLGYAVAASRLQAQLHAQGIVVDAQHPLFVYLPCGVGGAPAGVSFGLKQVFGAHVHCFFAEPVASPCVLLRMLYPDRPGISIYDIGLDNRTDADGLAVPVASELAVDVMRPLLSGVFTVEDDALFRHLYQLQTSEGIRIEPSAAAGFAGPGMLLQTDAGRAYLQQNGLEPLMGNANHILWTTGGLFVPEDEYAGFLARGKALDAE